jgi:Tfp pilus assembly protein PilV
MNKRISAKPGFSLIEAILAGALLLLMITAIAGILVYSRESVTTAGARNRAVFLAEAGLEAVRAIRDEDFANLVDGTYGLDNTTGIWTLSGTPDVTDIFTRTITISTIDASTKEVIAQIDWTQTGQRTGQTILTTRLANWH